MVECSSQLRWRSEGNRCYLGNDLDVSVVKNDLRINLHSTLIRLLRRPAFILRSPTISG